MKTFETNKTYQMRFIGDSDLIVPVKVIKVTPKSVKIELHGKVKSCKIHSYGDSEYIFPEGKYSMAPTCKASRLF